MNIQLNTKKSIDWCLCI